MPSNRTSPRIIRGFAWQPIEFLPAEEVLSGIRSWHHHRRLFWQGNGHLVLTTQRVIFRKIRLSVSHDHEWKIDEIEAIGPAKPSWLRLSGFLKSWYVEAQGERHYFSPWLIFEHGWLQKLQKISGLLIGEPRALYS